MTVERNRIGWGFWLLWVLASTVGMFVGFFMGLLTSAFTYDILGDLLKTLVFGIELGLGVGVLQWLVLRRRVYGAGWWVLASVAGGYGITQAGLDGLSDSLSVGALLSYTGVVALGGAVTGTLQWLILRGGGVSRPSWWVLASTVGYGLVGAVLGAFPWGGGDKDVLVALVVTAAVLGAVTGGALVWLLRQPLPEA